ncbi:MAG: hypothetical protein HY867_02985 [Chloroflexi bacterium]|nr:hypothetical protein [Chloroflexota bacterium]
MTRLSDNGWRMDIPAGDASAYRFAQLDDYSRLPRSRFPSQPPLTLSLCARTSSASVTGTWGFGLWNDPFGLSLGFGGNPFRLPALPNAIWFFHASGDDVVRTPLRGRCGIPQDSAGFHPAPRGENWLSFSDKPGNGFLAQAFRSPKIPSPLLASLGLLSLPIVLPALATRRMRKWLRWLAGRFIRDDSVRVSVDQTQWHAYRLEWSLTRSAFWVDEALVFESPLGPRPPLGVVIWIDNQFARFAPEGEIGFGVLEGEAEWLEVDEVVLRKM